MTDLLADDALPGPTDALAIARQVEDDVAPLLHAFSS
jgi:hypothetical protein